VTIEVTAYAWVPPFAQGYVRDLRVRWALEEAGLPYEARLISRADPSTDTYRSWQPFGQVPAYKDDEVEMFESGAIVMHIADKSEALSPRDPAGRGRVMTWVVAALNSIEPFAQAVIEMGDDAIGKGEPTPAEALLDERLTSLSTWLGEKDYLEGRFTAGDLLMVCVLRELVESGVLARFPNLDAYRQRGEARPAFGRAMEAQMKPFRENAPA
jgi:glutathione S-transferase